MRFFPLICLFVITLNCQSKDVEDQQKSDRPEPLVHPQHTVAAKNSDHPQVDMPNSSSTKSSPKISFDKVRFNFGEIYHADRVNHEFAFTNKGDVDLEIKGARASCGCTTPSFPTTPIKPGETGVIAVTYNSVGKQGAQKATIRVATNDPSQPEVVLYLSGRVLVKPRKE